MPTAQFSDKYNIYLASYFHEAKQTYATVADVVTCIYIGTCNIVRAYCNVQYMYEHYFVASSGGG